MGSGRPIQRFRSFLITATKLKNVKEYFVFREEWYELRKSLSKNAWYELETLMLQLRWDGVDTDPKTIKSKTVRTLWVSVRQRILDSMENCERKKKQRAKASPQDNDFHKSDFKAHTSPDNNTDNTNYHNSIESVPNATKTSITEEDKTNGSMYIGTIKELEEKTKARESCQSNTKDAAKVEIEAQNADLNDNFDNYSERLYNLIDDNIAKIRQSTDILAQKQIEIGSQMDNTVAFHRNVLYDLRKRLGWDTKDGLDFQQFIDEEINRKTAQIRYERAI